MVTSGTTASEGSKVRPITAPVEGVWAQTPLANKRLRTNTTDQRGDASGETFSPGDMRSPVLKSPVTDRTWRSYGSSLLSCYNKPDLIELNLTSLSKRGDLSHLTGFARHAMH